MSVELPPRLGQFPRQFHALADLARFIDHPTDRVLARRHADAWRAYLAGGDPVAHLGLPAGPGKLRRLLRDAWLYSAHLAIGGSARDLHQAVRAFEVHPWPVWRSAPQCPPLHRDHAPGTPELYRAFKHGRGRVPDSSEFYRALVSAPTFSAKKFALAECWHAAR